MSVFLIACSQSYANYEIPTSTVIPDLPDNVFHKDVKLPDKAVKGKKDNSKLIKLYEEALSHDKRAIDAAIKHNQKLQSIYNK